MAYLKIEINVKNPNEVISTHKGQIVGLASKLLKKGKKEALVQCKIYEEMQAHMNVELAERLKEEGVDAEFSVEIIDDQEKE